MLQLTGYYCIYKFYNPIMKIIISYILYKYINNIYIYKLISNNLVF